MTKYKKLLKLIEELDDETLYMNAGFEHIQSYLRKDGFSKKYPDKKTLMSRKAFSLVGDLEGTVKIVNKIIKEYKKIENIYVQSNTKKQIQREEDRSKRSSKSNV